MAWILSFPILDREIHVPAGMKTVAPACTSRRVCKCFFSRNDFYVQAASLGDLAQGARRNFTSAQS